MGNYSQIRCTRKTWLMRNKMHTPSKKALKMVRFIAANNYTKAKGMKPIKITLTKFLNIQNQTT